MPLFFDSGQRGTPPEETDRILTVPNLLSLVRLAAMPFIYLDMVNGRELRAFIVLTIVAWSDYFDGYLARRLGQVSRIGRLFDPISDRVLVVLVAVAMVVSGILPVWAVVLPLARDVVVLVGGIALLVRGQIPPEVSDLGKAGTFGLMLALGMFLLARVVGSDQVRSAAWVILLSDMLIYYLSAAQYVSVSVRRLRHGEPA